jgi:hypothetical protein
MVVVDNASTGPSTVEGAPRQAWAATRLQQMTGLMQRNEVDLIPTVDDG